MKQIFFVLSFFVVASMTTVQAQSEGKACSKSEKKACCAKKKASTASLSTADEGKVVLTAAQVAADNNPNIESKTCAKSGKVSYYEKSECPVSGKVSLAEVTYDEEAGKFVNVSPSEMKHSAHATSTEPTRIKAVKTGTSVE